MPPRGNLTLRSRGQRGRGQEGRAAPTLGSWWLHIGRPGDTDTEQLRLPGEAGPSPTLHSHELPQDLGPTQGVSWSSTDIHLGREKEMAAPWGEPSTRPAPESNEITDLIFNDHSVELAMKKTKHIPQEILEERCLHYPSPGGVAPE